MRKPTAPTKSSSWIHDIYCRPSPVVPPRAWRTRLSRVSKTPPRSGLIVIALRNSTLRVSGVAAALSSRFPSLGHFDTETPGAGGRWFVPAQNAGRLVIVGVVAMGIDRGGAGLQPHARRAAATGDRPAKHFGRSDSRVKNLAAIPGGVAAIDAPASQVDHGIDSFERGGPIAEGLAVPAHHLPRRCGRPAADDGYVMPLSRERRVSSVPTCPVPPKIVIFIGRSFPGALCRRNRGDPEALTGENRDH